MYNCLCLVTMTMQFIHHELPLTVFTTKLTDLNTSTVQFMSLKITCYLFNKYRLSTTKPVNRCCGVLLKKTTVKDKRQFRLKSNAKLTRSKPDTRENYALSKLANALIKHE